MSVRRSILMLALAMAIFPTAFFAVRANQTRTEAETRANRTIQTYNVALGSVEVTVNAIGRVEADQVTRLAFTSAGRVVEIPVEVGSLVQTGDLLLRQTDDAGQITVEQAELAVQMAILQRDQRLDGVDQSQVRIAEAQVDAARGALAAASGAVTDADLNAARLQYEATQQAVIDAQAARATASGGQSQEAYALLDARVGQATFNAEIARLQYEALQNSDPAQIGAAAARVEQAEAELARLGAPPPQAQIDSAEAAIAQAQLQLDAANAALTRLQLVAPFDGVVTALNAEIGGVVAPGLAVIEITDLSPLRLTVQVDEIDVRQIREGIPARVRFDALAGVELAATLERISVVSRNDAGVVNYDVRVRLDEADDRARVGMTAEASVVVESRDGVIVVPNEYIRLDRASGGAFVNRILPDGTLEEMAVTLGLQGQDTSEITEGVEVGDVIGIDLSGDAIGILGG